MTPTVLRKKGFDPRPLIIAHRGHSAAAPENSVAALNAAVAARADIVECDVRIAADSVPVVSHDADLQRLTGRWFKVADTPSTTLEAVANDAGASVLPLTRLMAAARGRIPLMLDVKSADPAVLQLIAGAAAETQFREEDIILGLRLPDLVTAARTGIPNAVILALHGASAPLDEFLDQGIRLVRLWETEASRAGVQALTERGCSVWVTTGGNGTGRPVGDTTADALAEVLDVGVSGVLVNDPGLAHRALCPVAAGS